MATKPTFEDDLSDSVAPHEKEVSPVSHAVPDASDPAAPFAEVSSKRQSMSDLFTIFCAGAALISDGYQNSLMTMVSQGVTRTIDDNVDERRRRMCS